MPDLASQPDYDGPAVPDPTAGVDTPAVTADPAPDPTYVPPAGFGQWVKFADGQEGIVVGEAGPDAMLLVRIGDTVVGQHRDNVVESSNPPPSA